jgi:sec-independent protein translocase protein TatA
MPNIGPLEIIVVLVIVLIIFGPKRLPDLGRSLGRGMREFKDSVTGKDKEEEENRLAELRAAEEQERSEEREPNKVAAEGDVS